MTETYLQWLKNGIKQIPKRIVAFFKDDFVQGLGFLYFGMTGFADIVLVLLGLLHFASLFYLIPWFLVLTYIGYLKSTEDINS